MEPAALAARPDGFFTAGDAMRALQARDGERLRDTCAAVTRHAREPFWLRRTGGAEARPAGAYS